MEKSCRSYFFQFDMIRTLNSVKTGEDTVGKVQMMIASNDFEMIRKLRKCLGVCADISADCAGGTVKDILDICVEAQPDIVLADMEFCGAVKEIRLRTDAKILMLAAKDQISDMVKISGKLFVSGYVFKDQPDLVIQTVKALAFGHITQEYLVTSLIMSELSPAERAVFYGMLGGNVALMSAPKTIANQKTNILKKLGLKSQKEFNHIFKYSKL